ncbi:MAG: UvrD-helicase domain-containing protein, partial [Pseudomonadota bacterium]
MSLDDATRAQVRAADPAASTWVSANAGSGKTRVLTDRVARLLLAGADPARILCLTFTKAAAAEMQDRLFRRLGAWAMLPEAKLAEALTGLSEDPVATDGEALARARRLFARALETPGGLKIQTIHAFCDAVLRRFPLEAGVSPRFRVLEEREAATLADAAFDRVAEEAPEAFDAFATLTDGGERGEVLASILGHPELFEDPPEARDHPDDATLLRDALGPDAPALAALREVMAGAGKSDAEAAETLAVALAGGEGVLDSLFKFVLTKTGAPRSLRTFPTKATRAAFPAAEALVATLQDRVLAAREARLAGAAAADDARLHRFARAFLDRYAAAKSAGGLLDFDDLVGRVRRLLTTAEMAGWVLWKLDGGLDHILVDEAQDTSPEQWAVIRALAAEFHAGEGARP